MRLTAAQIAEAAGGKVISGNPETIIENITTDSHTIKGADLFIPIKGARTDGHRFIPDVAEAGAAASFTAYDLEGLKEVCQKELPDIPLIQVEDPRTALQELGGYYRDHFVPIPYIGVTGSVGKTTSREMIVCALSAGKKVYSTKGNANSQVGVPITVTETDPDAEIGVIEMGISEFGEMSRISRVVKCDMAVVTVIGVSHIGNLGTQDNIMREKLKICECMKPGGLLLLNGDDPLLSRSDLQDFLPAEVREHKIRVIYYGTGENAFVRAEKITESGGCASYELKIGEEICLPVRLEVPGRHMVLNSLAALAAAYFNQVDLKAAAKALESFRSLDGRGRMFRKNGITVINDAYNAAPQSVMAGLKVLNDTECSGRRIAVLADMLELGPEEVRYHREVGEYIASETPRVGLVLLYGALASHIGDGIREKAAGEGGNACPQIFPLKSVDEVKDLLIRELKEGDTVFFKGSNSMKLGPLVKDIFGDE